jgi:hypothetical protein
VAVGREVIYEKVSHSSRTSVWSAGIVTHCLASASLGLPLLRLPLNVAKVPSCCLSQVLRVVNDYRGDESWVLLRDEW